MICPRSDGKRTIRSSSSSRTVPRWGLREEAAVAGSVAGLEDRHLPLEAEGRAVHDRDVVPDRCVVDEVTGREVVGAVDDHIPARLEDPLDAVGGEPLAERNDL